MKAYWGSGRIAPHASGKINDTGSLITFSDGSVKYACVHEYTFEISQNVI
jgi:hypothetical protein